MHVEYRYSDNVSLKASFKCSLFPEVGPMPNWYQSRITNPSAQCFADFAGSLRMARPNEALFYGSRRVENLVRYSEHLSATGVGRWDMVGNISVNPIEDVRRKGSNGDMSLWKLSRSNNSSSVLRTNSFLKRRDMPSGLDLLSGAPHFFGINARKATTNTVSTMEIQVYVSGSGPTVSKIITLDDEVRTYGLIFTPKAAMKISSLSWQSGILTVTCLNHGYGIGNNIRISGNIPTAYDIDGAILNVIDQNAFTVSMPNNPGTLQSLGWTQYGYRIGISPGSFASTAFGDIEVEFPYVSEMCNYPSGYVAEYVPHDAAPPDSYWYGAGVDGVRYFDHTPCCLYNATTGLVLKGSGRQLDTCKGLVTYPYSVNLITRNYAENISSWESTNSITLDNAELSPLGEQEASVVKESNATGRHYVSLPEGTLNTSNMPASTLANISFFIKVPSSEHMKEWVYISFRDRAGVEQFSFINIKNLSTGSKSSGIRSVHIEPLFCDGNRYCRVQIRLTTGVGGGNPNLALGLAQGNNSFVYQGDGESYIVLWGVDIICGSGRPVAAPYGRGHISATASRAGSMVQFNLRGLLGTDNFAVSSKCTPYFDPTDVDRQDWAGITYMDCGGPQFVTSATPNSLSPYGGDRLGVFFRPNPFPGGTHYTKIAFDIYKGDPTANYLFKSGTYYREGECVVPSDTRANNSNNRKIWRVKASGVSAEEPVWPSVTSLPSVEVTSGSATFICDHDNGIVGSFEPYDGSNVSPPSGFMTEVRAAWYLGRGEYGLFVNGTEGTKDTWPIPINPTGFQLRYNPKLLLIGRLQNDAGIDPNFKTSFMGSDSAGLMPRLTMFHRDVTLWSGARIPTHDLKLMTE